MSALHIRFWVFMIALMFFAGPLYKTPKQMHEFVREEAAVTVKALGKTWGGGIVARSAKIFQSAPVQMGTLIFHSGEFDPEKMGNQNVIYKSWGTQIFLNLANKMMAGWGAMLFIMSIRFMIILSWFGLLAPMIIAACIDGVSQRKIKFFNFRSIRPATYTLLSFFVIPFALGPLIYLVVPFAISPAYIPVITSVMLLPLSLLLANSQPLFGEK